MYDPQKAEKKIPMWMGVAIVVAGLLVVGGLGYLVLRGGASSSGPSPSSQAQKSSTPAVSATPSGTNACNPKATTVLTADTAFAKAPKDVQQVWTNPANGLPLVAIIPATNMPCDHPPTPKVVNDTNGAIDDATAQQWGEDLMRSFAIENWSFTHGYQVDWLNGTIGDPGPETYSTLPAGATDGAIAGNRWPEALKLVTVPAVTQQLFTSQGKTSPFQYAFLVSTKEGWTLQYPLPDGQTQSDQGETIPANSVIYVAGHEASSVFVGDFWWESNSNICGASWLYQPEKTLCVQG